jgi:hypothetical protein
MVAGESVAVRRRFTDSVAAAAIILYKPFQWKERECRGLSSLFVARSGRDSVSLIF